MSVIPFVSSCLESRLFSGLSRAFRVHTGAVRQLRVLLLPLRAELSSGGRSAARGPPAVRRASHQKDKRANNDTGRTH